MDNADDSEDSGEEEGGDVHPPQMVDGSEDDDAGDANGDQDVEVVGADGSFYLVCIIYPKFQITLAPNHLSTTKIAKQPLPLKRLTMKDAFLPMEATRPFRLQLQATLLGVLLSLSKETTNVLAGLTFFGTCSNFFLATRLALQPQLSVKQ